MNIQKKLLLFFVLISLFINYNCDKNNKVNENIFFIENVNSLSEWSKTILILFPDNQKMLFGEKIKIYFNFSHKIPKEKKKLIYYEQFFSKSKSFNENQPYLYSLEQTNFSKRIKILFIPKNANIKKYNKKDMIDFIFLENPNMNVLLEISKLNVNQAIICTGRYPKEYKQISNRYRVKIITSNSLTYWLSNNKKKIIPIFFFSNKKGFLG